MILITGGAGFIGFNFVLNWLKNKSEEVLIVDKLVYPNSSLFLKKIRKLKNTTFIKSDINDNNLISNIFEKYRPRYIVNFAAESHVDTSIKSPEVFLDTNILGTFNLLQNSLKYWNKLKDVEKENFRFLHISTDEVFGSLRINQPSVVELDKYYPNNPYSASKASSEHFVRAYNKTYNLPVIITNCSNNYGPFQQSEKLIPNTIKAALLNKNIPVYGNGLNIRDWIYVEDHCFALNKVLDLGVVGENYNIGGNNEVTNIEIVKTICDILDETIPKKDKRSYNNLITFVEDRLGHDIRYSVNTNKIETKLSWKPTKKFEDGIYETVKWYVNNQKWLS